MDIHRREIRIQDGDRIWPIGQGISDHVVVGNSDSTVQYFAGPRALAQPQLGSDSRGKSVDDQNETAFMCQFPHSLNGFGVFRWHAERMERFADGSTTTVHHPSSNGCPHGTDPDQSSGHVCHRRARPLHQFIEQRLEYRYLAERSECITTGLVERTTNCLCNSSFLETSASTRFFTSSSTREVIRGWCITSSSSTAIASSCSSILSSSARSRSARARFSCVAPEASSSWSFLTCAFVGLSTFAFPLASSFFRLDPSVSHS